MFLRRERVLWALALVATIVLSLDVRAQTAGEIEAEADSPAIDTPLFSSHEVLEFTIEADIDQLKKDRQQDSPERPASIYVAGPGGEEIQLEVQVRTRGNFRLKRRTCNFPPVRLNFKKKAVVGTVFEGQDKLKLVLHCQDGRDEYEQYVLQEYLIYRMYNQLTPLSFRVRLARITYVDVSQHNDTLTKYAFLIEDEDDMAARNGGVVEEYEQFHPGRLNHEASALQAVFQYMIGNTDWGYVTQHNMKLAYGEDGYRAIPYDFDHAGLISARYAEPADRLGLRNVRQRLYRGFCRETVDFAPILERFREEQDAIYELFRSQVGLSEQRLERSLDYLDSFYETINNEGRTRGRILEMCRPW